jgi:D-alanine--poly(phosphoribitol) ligase subunit 1
MTEAGLCPVVARVRRMVRDVPDLTAVVGPDRRLSYAELWREAESWRRRCEALGLPARSLVGLVADGQTALPAAFLGVRAAGLVPVLMDASRGLDTLAAARPAVVVTLADDLVEPTGDATARVLPEGTGYVVFSSGSQGAPKGIAGQALGLARFIDWERELLDVRPGARTAMLTSPAFDVVYRDLLLALCSGAELHIPDSRTRVSPSRVVPWIAEHNIEIVHIVPSLAARWAASAVPAPSLRWSLFAGEPLHSRHIDRWRKIAPDSRIVNLYGPAETTLAKFAYLVPPLPADGLQPVGRPLPDTAVEFEPAGAESRVVIRTPDGSLGYLADTCSPDDARRLRRTAGTTRFETQDRGRLDEDGNLVVSGRLDSLVKRYGSFVDLAWIEAAATAVPGVRAVCCVQVPGGDAIVLTVEGSDLPSEAALRRLLHSRLGHQLPDRIDVIDALPLLAGGKVDRRAISNRYLEVRV